MASPPFPVGRGPGHTAWLGLGLGLGLATNKRFFAGRLNPRGTRTCLPRRAGGATPARQLREALSAAATPLARRPRAMSHRTGAPLERGGGGSTEVIAVCHPTLALGRSSKHALHRASRAARSARRLQHPHSPPGDKVRSSVESTCRRPGAPALAQARDCYTGASRRRCREARASARAVRVIATEDGYASVRALVHRLPVAIKSQRSVATMMAATDNPLCRPTLHPLGGT